MSACARKQASKQQQKKHHKRQGGAMALSNLPCNLSVSLLSREQVWGQGSDAVQPAVSHRVIAGHVGFINARSPLPSLPLSDILYVAPSSGCQVSSTATAAWSSLTSEEERYHHFVSHRDVPAAYVGMRESVCSDPLPLFPLLCLTPERTKPATTEFTSTVRPFS